MEVDDGAAAAILDRALRYPYDRPRAAVSFDVATGAAVPLDDHGPGTVSGRTAVLAIGSNAAPEQLARKFPSDGPVGGTIPILPARLRDHDVVFAARLSSYGALPATFHPSPGTSVDVHVTLLDAAQLEVLHRSEGVHGDRPAYRVVPVDPALVRTGAPVADGVLAYQAVDGPWRLDGVPIALAAIGATGRTWPALTERDALAELATHLGTGTAELVRSVVDDPARRAAVSARLRDGTGTAGQRRP